MKLCLAHELQALDFELAFPGGLTLKFLIDCRYSLHEVLNVVLVDSPIAKEQAG